MKSIFVSFSGALKINDSFATRIFTRLSFKLCTSFVFETSVIQNSSETESENVPNLVQELETLGLKTDALEKSQIMNSITKYNS